MPSPRHLSEPGTPPAPAGELTPCRGPARPSRRMSARTSGETDMRFRPVYALLGLCLIALTTGCCHDRWCCRHPFAPRCRSECAPACGCCNPCPCGFPPSESVPPPPVFAPAAPH